MNKFVNVSTYENTISISFNIEMDEIMKIGDRLNKLHDEAYMNGYNWEMLLGYYLKRNAPELLEGMDPDPEAGMYAAYYELSDENMIKANKFAEIIIDLVENENKLYELVKNEGNEIPWD